VDEAGQSTEVCDGLSGKQTCVWARIVVVKKSFCHIFMGTNPPEKLLQFPHRRDSPVVSNMAVNICELRTGCKSFQFIPRVVNYRT
jgi:hypothetical protein